MNPHTCDDGGFDAQARTLHRAALAQMSPRTPGAPARRHRHEAQRAAPASGDARPWRWLTATAFTAVLAVGVGLQFLPRAPTPSSPAVTTRPHRWPRPTAKQLDETAAGTLEEDPDLYLWLASAEGAAPCDGVTHDIPYRPPLRPRPAGLRVFRGVRPVAAARAPARLEKHAAAARGGDRSSARPLEPRTRGPSPHDGARAALAGPVAEQRAQGTPRDEALRRHEPDGAAGRATSTAG